MPRADLERTLNMGVGFVAMVPAAHVGRGHPHRSRPAAYRRGLIGEVTALDGAPIEEGVEVVRGAKGVEGGAVQVVGEHPLA